MSTRQTKRQTQVVLRQVIRDNIIPDEKISEEEITTCKDIITQGIQQILQNPAFRENEPHLRATMELVEYATEVAQARSNERIESAPRTTRAVNRSIAMLPMLQRPDDEPPQTLNRIDLPMSRHWERYKVILKYFSFVIIAISTPYLIQRVTHLVETVARNKTFGSTSIVSWVTWLMLQLLEIESEEDAVEYITIGILLLGLLFVIWIFSANEFEFLGVEKPTRMVKSQKSQSKPKEPSPKQSRPKRATVLALEAKKTKTKTRSS